MSTSKTYISSCVRMWPYDILWQGTLLVLSWLTLFSTKREFRNCDPCVETAAVWLLKKLNSQDSNKLLVVLQCQQWFLFTPCFLQDEKYDHIEKSDVEKVEFCLTEKEKWRDQKQNAQAQIPLTKDPVVLSSQIRSELQVIISPTWWSNHLK